MPRREVTGRKPGGDEGANARPSSIQASIPEFCYAHRISVDHYYKLQREGKGPDIMKAGARTLITNEAAGRWREEGEAAAREAGKSKAKEKYSEFA